MTALRRSALDLLDAIDVYRDCPSWREWIAGAMEGVRGACRAEEERFQESIRAKYPPDAERVLAGVEQDF